MPSSPDRLGLKVYACALWIYRQPRTFIENRMEAWSFASAHRSGNADALYRAAGYESSQRLCGNDSLHRVWIQPARCIERRMRTVGCRKPGWLNIGGAGKTKVAFRSSH